MSTATVAPMMTAEEFVRDYGDGTGVELERGQLVRLPVPGANHDGIEANATLLFGNFIKSRRIGRTMCGETLIRVLKDPPTFRGSDFTFLSYKRWPKKKPLPDGPLEFPPDLVLEVRSPTDRWKRLRQKTDEYLEAGVQVVLILDPDTESVGVYRDEEFPVIFHNGDTVLIPDVLPGFSAPVKAFFE